MKKAILALTILALIITGAFAHPGKGQRFGGPPIGKEIRAQLTDIQMEMLCEEIGQLHQSDATKAKIQAAVKAKLLSFGVDLPDDWKMGRPNHPPHMRRIMSQLTDLQRETVEAKIQSMHEAGASKQEVRTEIHKLLNEWGIQPPEGCRMQDGQQGPPPSQQHGYTKHQDMKLSSSNYPNPANPETTISYELQQPGSVQVQVYDIQGQLVQTLVDDYQNAGTYESVWNGHNSDGQQVASGTYFYQVASGGENLTKQMILLK